MYSSWGFISRILLGGMGALAVRPWQTSVLEGPKPNLNTLLVIQRTYIVAMLHVALLHAYNMTHITSLLIQCTWYTVSGKGAHYSESSPWWIFLL